MEVQMATQGRKPTGHGGGAIAKPVPGYLRPSAGSCHHVCKYGGTHTFEDHKEAHKPQPRPPRKQPPPPAPAPAPAPAESHHNHNRVLVKVRSVFRRRVADSTTATQKPSKAAASKAKAAKVGESVEWKDIVAYDTVPLPPHGSSSPGLELDKTSAQVTGSGGNAKKKKDVMEKGKKSYGKAKIHEQVESVQGRQNEPLDTNASNYSDRSVRPPKAKNKPAAMVLVENMGIDRETLQGYQILSPSLAQSRANLLRDLEKEMMVQEPENVKEEWTTVTYSLNPEEYAAAESSRPIPAHRRVQSMSMGVSSRSARHSFARQASRNSGAFMVRSRSTRAPVIPPEEKPARLRSRKGEDASSAGTGRGIHLRIRSLRRHGVVAPVAWALVASSCRRWRSGIRRHQKTLEKKKSQRLYNNLIEETATRLVKTRKSRVKALVGAFESVISKIAK